MLAIGYLHVTVDNATDVRINTDQLESIIINITCVVKGAEPHPLFPSPPREGKPAVRIQPAGQTGSSERLR